MNEVATTITPSTITLSTITLSTDASGRAVATLRGEWSIQSGLADPFANVEEITGASAKVLAFESSELGRWDSGLLIFLRRLEELLGERGVAIERDGLPEGVRSILALAEAVPEREGARGADEGLIWIGEFGVWATDFWRGLREGIGFLGSCTIAFGRLLTGRARFRRSDFLLFVQEAGAEALPIVSLISFLVGTILAFVGAVQLQQFGAAIYVANLVGIAMVRDMGAMMTGIVMAGRTGAAYAAQLGSMKVNQEIDALTTMGISPLEFLVLPRMLALAVMMPLLCLYSDAMGILGGAAVGVLGLGLSPVTYFQYTEWAVQIDDLVGGVVKASVYGILIALFGCMRGMQSGNSSSAVGEATTRAVVSSIVAIVSACGLFALVFYVLGI